MAPTRRRIVVDPDSGDVLTTCTADALSIADERALIELGRAAQRRYRALPAEVRADLEARQAASQQRTRERAERLRKGAP
jgi:hypothetical protein